MTYMMFSSQGPKKMCGDILQAHTYACSQNGIVVKYYNNLKFIFYIKIF